PFWFQQLMKGRPQAADTHDVREGRFTILSTTANPGQRRGTAQSWTSSRGRQTAEGGSHEGRCRHWLARLDRLRTRRLTLRLDRRACGPRARPPARGTKLP